MSFDFLLSTCFHFCAYPTSEKCWTTNFIRLRIFSEEQKQSSLWYCLFQPWRLKSLWKLRSKENRGSREKHLRLQFMSYPVCFHTKYYLALGFSFFSCSMQLAACTAFSTWQKCQCLHVCRQQHRIPMTAGVGWINTGIFLKSIKRLPHKSKIECCRIAFWYEN